MRKKTSEELLKCVDDILSSLEMFRISKETVIFQQNQQSV